MYLLPTYTNNSEIQLTVVPLTPTIHKSSEHPLSLAQPTVLSPAFPWQRLLTFGDSSALCPQVLPLQPPLRSSRLIEFVPCLHLGTDYIENTSLLFLRPIVALLRTLLPSNGKVSWMFNAYRVTA
jgi:hypothetical protein